jgi:hypothetical protein
MRSAESYGLHSATVVAQAYLQVHSQSLTTFQPFLLKDLKDGNLSSMVVQYQRASQTKLGAMFRASIFRSNFSMLDKFGLQHVIETGTSIVHGKRI